jgi:hypothetical protein
MVTDLLLSPLALTRHLFPTLRAGGGLAALSPAAD